MDASFVTVRRRLLRLSQRELADLSGVKQPLISAIERGRRDATPAVAKTLTDVLQMRPSVALERLRAEVRSVVCANHGREAHVFGSVARGQDAPSSDLDLIVEFDDEADITDLLAMEEELQRLLTVPVDVVSAGASSPVTNRARLEMVPL